MTPEKYCEDKVKQSGSSFYYSFLFLDEVKKREIFAIYAFCREIDDIVDNIQDPTVSQTKLSWWANDFNKCYNNKLSPEHPVNIELKPIIKKYNLDKKIFEDLLYGMQMDLNKTQYSTVDDLLKYCYCVAGTVGILCVNIFGYSNQKTFEYAENLANFLQLVNIIRDLQEDINKYKRIYIPNNLLNKHNLSHQDLQSIINNDQSNKSSNKLNNNFLDLISELIELAESYYSNYKKLISPQDLNNQFSGYIMGEIYKSLLNKIKKNKNLLLKPNKISIPPIKKLYIAWKTNRYIKKQYNNYLKTCTQ